MMELFHRGEVLPEGRTNEEEVRLIALDQACGKGGEHRLALLSFVGISILIG